MSELTKSTTPVGFLLCDDMIFTSRVTGTASDLGLTVKPARSIQALNSFLEQQTPRCVIVDLSHPGLEIAHLIRDLQEKCAAMPYVVGYGSHVDTARLRGAREAGCDLVLPRSKFVEELPRALPDWFGK